MGRPPGEYRALAAASAKKAIEIDDENAEAHAALGFAKLYDWDWAGAELELRRALELNPSYASGHVWHATSLAIRLRFDEAAAEVERAHDLDPLSLITQTQVGWIYKFAGRDEDAIAQFRKVLATDPNFLWALWQLGGAYAETGRFAQAIEVLEKAAVVSKNSPAVLGSLGRAYAEAGRRGGGAADAGAAGAGFETKLRDAPRAGRHLPGVGRPGRVFPVPGRGMPAADQWHGVSQCGAVCRGATARCVPIRDFRIC